MADEKITGLPAASSVGGTDLGEIVQGGTNKKATYTIIKDFLATFFAQVFTDLTDVPSSYTGGASKVVSVKSDESGLEFTTPASITTGNLTDVGTDGIVVTGGTGAVVGSGTSLAQHVSDSTHNGYLSQTDWSTFNGKQNTITTGNLTDAGTDGIVVTGGTNAVIGSGASIAQHVADATHNGYLSSTDWTSFSSGAAGGTVTSFSAGTLPPLFTTSVATATTTPALSFILTDAGANTYLGNSTGGSTAPSYTASGSLTKTDDTNVTLALGGNPTTSLLRSTSLTLGWTGTLAIARGGFGKAMTDPNADRLVIWDDTDGDFQYVTVGTGLLYTHATHTLTASATAQTRSVTFCVNAANTVVSPGDKAYVKIPYGGTLTGWLLIGSPSGSVTVDILRSADGAGLPVTSIVGAGTKPALSSSVENSSTTFTSWTSTTLNAKDNLGINVSGISTITYVSLTLYFS